jgi:hypothetical protein
MNKSLLAACLLFAGFWSLACGASKTFFGGSLSGRQLQSISIQETESGGEIQLTATGTFSSPPTTVSPLPVFWSFAPPPGQYTLSTQPFLLQCTTTGTYPRPIIAWAPANPNAPSSGSMSGTQMVNASTSINCP